MRHRIFRHLAVLVALVLTMSALVPGFARSTLAQSDAPDNEIVNSEFPYRIGWNDPWTEISEADAPALMLSDDAGTTITLRGEEEGLAPADRLQQEIAQIVYLNGTTANVTDESDDVATAEWRSNSLSRLVSVIAAPDAGAIVIVTLVAPAADFDAALASAAEDVTLEGDPLPVATPGTPDRPDDKEQVKEPAEQPSDESSETPDIKLPTQEPLGNGVDGSTYTSPNFGYSFEWDDSVWEVAEDGEYSAEMYDQLTLDSDSGRLNIYAFEDYDGDPAACLAGESEYYGTDPSIEDYEQATDDNGDPIGGETSTSAFGVYTSSYTIDESEGSRSATVTLVGYIECRHLSDTAVLVIAAFAPKQSYNNFVDQFVEVTDSIVLYDESATSDDVSPEATETPESDRDAEDAADDTGTGSGSDDDTTGRRPADPGVRPGQTEDNATPEAAIPGDERDSDDTSGETAIEGSVFTSPGFGFTLDIPATWSVEDEQLDEGNETLILNNGTSTVTVWATSEFDGETLPDCVRFAADAAEHDLTPELRADGSVFQGSDDLSAYAAYTYDDDGTETTWFAKCQWIDEGQSVLIIIQDVPTADYASERRARRQIENLIELP
jgi:hypothetical protein